MSNMWKSLIHADLRTLPKLVFLLVLLFYPLIAYAVTKTMGEGMDMTKAFGLICLAYMAFVLFQIFKSRSNLVIPLYVIFFGLFTIYTMLCGMFMTDYFNERGIKYFYSDPIWLTFVSLLIVENTYFSENLLKFARKILLLTLILASVVSVIQISNPLFFNNNEILVEGLSYERMADYYSNGPRINTAEEMGKVSRFLDGYRLSIFSYIKELSVGIDTIAIFSLLVAWRPMNLLSRGAATLSSAIVSFLSSSRWIMLNFLIVASQILWTGKNKLANVLYFILVSTGLLVIIALVANVMGLDVEQFLSERLMSDSALTRFLAFEVFFEVFPDNPIFGTGGEDTEKMLRLLGGKSSQIHVGYLKLFYYYGLIGGLLYLSFIVAFLTRLWKMAKFSKYWGGFFAILVFFVANLTLFELSLFYYGPLLAIIFANYSYFNRVNEETTSVLGDESEFSLN